MESMVWGKFKKSCPLYYRFFRTWKSRLKPEKKHWVLAIFFIAVTVVISYSIFPFLQEYSPETADFVLNGVTVFSIAFTLLFYFLSFKYLKVKRLSGFVPLASAIMIIYFVSFFILYLAVYPINIGIFNPVPIIISTLLATVIFYLSFIVEGMGAMGIFIKQFRKQLIAKGFFLGVTSFLLSEFLHLFFPAFFAFSPIRLNFETLMSIVLSIAHPMNWDKILMLFFFFCFVFYFKRTDRKHVFLPVFAILLVTPLLQYFSNLLLGGEPSIPFFAFYILLQDFALPVSFTIVFLLYSLFSKLFNLEASRQA